MKMYIKNLCPTDGKWFARYTLPSKIVAIARTYDKDFAVACWVMVEIVEESEEKATASRIPLPVVTVEIHGMIRGEKGLQDAETVDGFVHYVRG